jgi:hypothetical protein
MDRRTFVTAAGTLGLAFVTYGTKAFDLQAKGKRVGIVGLDSSHAIAFTKELNANQGTDIYKGYTVVAAYPMGSPGIPLNAKRIPQFTEEIKRLDVKIVDSITQLLKQVDVVLLETNDGNLHLKQAEEIIKARKPLFIDKPIANSYQDAAKIFALAEKYNTPVFSTSSLRYIEGLAEIDKKSVLGADIYSPAHLEPSHKDLYWYGIHGVEMLFALLGPECLNVQVTHSENVDICVGRWAGGKIGVLRGTRNGVDAFGGTAYTVDKTITLGAYKGYSPMLKRIVDFYETGQAPVDNKETLAICKFIDAAYQSRINGGLLTVLQ